MRILRTKNCQLTNDWATGVKNRLRIKMEGDKWWLFIRGSPDINVCVVWVFFSFGVLSTLAHLSFNFRPFSRFFRRLRLVFGFSSEYKYIFDYVIRVPCIIIIIIYCRCYNILLRAILLQLPTVGVGCWLNWHCI